MGNDMKKDTIAGLDIGTTSVRAVITERTTGDERLSVVGVGTAANEGLRFGVVVDIEKTVQAITGAIEQAELVSVSGECTPVSPETTSARTITGE